MPEKAAADTSKYLLCPMPGLVKAIHVAEGQEVKAGDALAVVEAMKMENILRAERDGTVKKVNAKAGRQPGGRRRDHRVRVMADRKLISSGSPFERKIGYSRAVVAGRWVFMSGTTGFDYQPMTIADKRRRAGRAVLPQRRGRARAGGRLVRRCRAHHYLAHPPRGFRAIWPVLQSTWARCARPAP